MTPDPEMMARAIELMRKSKGEDSRPHPSVGVVVVKNGKKIAEGCRGDEKGEPGEHAEFGVLQRTLGGANLKGATLYTTLEPCSSRRHPKYACAEWIVSRGIRTVVIGILDRNPNICGKGFWLLREHGIDVHFFPPTLMNQIQRENHAFFESCRQLAEPISINEGTDESHSKAEDLLIKEYLSQPDFPARCYAGGVWKPNLAFTRLPKPARSEIAELVCGPWRKKPEIVRRDLFLIKALSSTREPKLLLYYSGKEHSGWNTWLIPNRKRDGKNALSRLESHAKALALDLDVNPSRVSIQYAKSAPVTISVKTNRYATEPAYRLIPKLFVFRYCFVLIDQNSSLLASPESTMMSGHYERRFRWFDPVAFENNRSDRKMWNANCDVLMTIETAFENSLVTVPNTFGRRKLGF